MRKILCGLAASALFLLLAGCGTVGEPVYPSAHIPVAPSDLSAVQRGNRIVAHFTSPAMTTDGRVLAKPGGAEIRAGVARQPFDADQWADGAMRATAQPAVEKPGVVDASVALTDGLAGKDIVVGARVFNSKGRASAWSNFVTVHVVAPVVAPTGVNATAVPEGVRVTWSDSAEHSFRVFRKGPDDKTPVEAGKTASPEYVDHNVVWGSQYQYWVQAMRGTAESETAASAAISPEDKFPPAVPSGLTAVTGASSIELAWERNTEPDFQRYLIYRAMGEGPMEKIGETEAPTYSDRHIEGGKQYRYAIAAVDQRGNVSGKSAAVEAVAP